MDPQWSTLPALATNVPTNALILYANQPTAVTWQPTADKVALATALVVYVR